MLKVNNWTLNTVKRKQPRGHWPVQSGLNSDDLDIKFGHFLSKSIRKSNTGFLWHGISCKRWDRETTYQDIIAASLRFIQYQIVLWPTAGIVNFYVVKSCQWRLWNRSLCSNVEQNYYFFLSKTILAYFKRISCEYWRKEYIKNGMIYM